MGSRSSAVVLGDRTDVCDIGVENQAGRRDPSAILAAGRYRRAAQTAGFDGVAQYDPEGCVYSFHLVAPVPPSTGRC